MLLVGLVAVVRPFFAQQRDFAAGIPSPAALASTDSVPLARGRPVCFRYAVADRRAAQARFKVLTGGPPASALTLTLTGPGGYRAVGRVPAGAGDTQLVSAAFAPAPPRAMALRACIASAGARPVALFASSDRTRSRSLASVGGRRIEKSVWFGFYEGSTKGFTERLGDTFDRMATFRPGFVGAWLLWPLFLAFLLGVPLVAVGAFVRAVEEDERAAEPFDLDRGRARGRRWLD